MGISYSGCGGIVSGLMDMRVGFDAGCDGWMLERL